jgi:hypothetical protein
MMDDEARELAELGVEDPEALIESRIKHAEAVEDLAQRLEALGFTRGRAALAEPEDDFWISPGVWPELNFTEAGTARLVERLEDEATAPSDA